MDIHQYRSDNGLRVIIIPRAGHRTVATRLFVRAGSRYDGELPGQAHLLEHLLFSGTANNKPEAIFSRIESRGGEINAHTTREYICLYTTTLDDQIDNALQVLSEIVIEPYFTQEKLNKEKLIIAEELKHARNKPDTIIDLFLQTLWQKIPLRNPIIGYPESITKISSQNISDFYQNQFVNKNSILVLCGNIDPLEGIEIAYNAFFDYPSGAETRPQVLEEDGLSKIKTIFQERDIPQSHMILGTQTVGMNHHDRSALKILEIILSMGASGRLYKRLRTELNLVYHINAFTSLFEDTGYFCVRAICDPESIETIKGEVFDLWQDIRKNNISSDELKNAKGYYAGTLSRHLETNSAVAGITGIEGLLGKIESIEEAITRINSVTLEDISQAANEYLLPEQSVSAVIGPKR